MHLGATISSFLLLLSTCRWPCVNEYTTAYGGHKPKRFPFDLNLGTGLRLSLVHALSRSGQITEISRKLFEKNLTGATYADSTRLQGELCEFPLTPATRVSVRSVENFLVEVGKKQRLFEKPRRVVAAGTNSRGISILWYLCLTIQKL